MRHRRTASAICLLVSGIAATIPASAKTFAYSTVYEQAHKLQKSIAGMDDLFVQASFDYSHCGVKTGDIQVYIQTSDGIHHPLVFDLSGHAAIPLDAALDNPGTLIVSSQDKGLGYSVNLGIRPPDAAQMSYDGLMDRAQQYTAAMRSQLGLLRFLAPKIIGLALVYTDSDATVIQHGFGRDITMHAEAADGFHGLALGVFVIKIPSDQAMQGRNTELRFNRLPNRIEPLFDASFEDKIARAAKDCKPD